MSKQKFDLGQEVYIFKMVGSQPKVAFGKVKIAEINSSGYIQYSVDIVTKNGKDQWLVNHASIANTEEEIKEKINAYMEYITAQRKIFEEKFGKPEFDGE